jgi:hypothetical protein
MRWVVMPLEILPRTEAAFATRNGAFKLLGVYADMTSRNAISRWAGLPCTYMTYFSPKRSCKRAAQSASGHYMIDEETGIGTLLLLVRRSLPCSRGVSEVGSPLDSNVALVVRLEGVSTVCDLLQGVWLIWEKKLGPLSNEMSLLSRDVYCRLL